MYGHEELFQDIGQINDSIHGDIGEVFSFSLENPVGSSSFSGRPVQSPQPTPGSSHNNSFAMGEMRSINSAFGMDDPQMSTPPMKQRSLRNPQKYHQGAMQQNSRTRRASADPEEMQGHHAQYMGSHQMNQQMSPQIQQPMNPQQMSPQMQPMNPQQMSPQMQPQMPPQQMGQMGHMQQPMNPQQMTPQMQAQQISQQISQQQLNQMQLAQMNQQMGQMGGQQMNVGPQGMNGHMGLQQMNQQQMTGPPMQGPMGTPQQQMGPGTPQMGPNQQMSGPMGQMGQQMGMGNPQMGQMGPQGMNGHHGVSMQQMPPQQMHGRPPQQRPHTMPMQMMNPEQQMADQQGYSRSVPMHMTQAPMQMQDAGPQVSRLRPKKTSILISQDQQSYMQQPTMVSNQNMQVKHQLVSMEGQPMVQNYSRPKNQLRVSQKSLHGQFVPGQAVASQEIPLHLPLQLPLGSQFQARPARANPMKYSQIVYQQPAIVSHAPIMTQAGNFRQIMPTRGILRISQERLLPPDSVIFGDSQQGGHPNSHYDSNDEVVTIEDFKNILNQINRTLRVLRGQGPPGAMEHLKNSCDQFRAFMIELQGSPQQQFYRKRVPGQQGQPQPPQQQPVGQTLYRPIEDQKMSMDNQSPLDEDDSGTPESDYLEDDSFGDDELKSKRKLRKLKGKSQQSKKKRLKLEADPGNPSPQLTDFEVRETLGSGTFGTVYLCKHKVTGNVYCLKKLEQATVYQLKQMEHLKNEKQVLMMVSHPGVVKLYKTFHDVTAVYLLMEFVPGGELFLYIRKYGRLSEETAKFYVVQIILVFEYLHSRGIVYRDLKPENLLLDENGHIKLADFGFSKQIQDRTWTMCGTPDYLAPEVIKFRGHSFPVDWWALGILIYEMVAGFTPFRDDTIMGLFAKILEPHLIEYPIEFSPEVTNLVGRFLVANPAHRLGSLANGTADIKNHAWFQGIDWETAARREGRAPIVPFLTSREDTSNFKVDPANAVAPQAAPPNTQIPPDVQEFFDSF